MKILLLFFAVLKVCGSTPLWAEQNYHGDLLMYPQRYQVDSEESALEHNQRWRREEARREYIREQDRVNESLNRRLRNLEQDVQMREYQHQLYRGYYNE